MPIRKRLSALLFCVVPMLAHCNSGHAPETIEVGRDACNHCRMTIADARFGGEIITEKGKVYKFDSIKCLVTFARENSGDTSAIYVENFLKPGELLKASDATFAALEADIGPMQSNEVAFASADGARRALATENPKLVGWEEIRESIAR